MYKTSNTLLSVLRTVGLVFVLSMTSLLSLADEQAKPADSDFSSVYAKYQSALEKQNTEETLKYAELSHELGKSKFSGTPENLSNLKYNLAIALDEANKSPESFALFEEIKKEYANLYGKESQEYLSVLIDQLATSRNNRELSFKQRKKAFNPIIRQAIDLTETLAEQYEDFAPLFYYNLASGINNSRLNSEFFRQSYKANRKAADLLEAKFGENDARAIEINFMLAKYYAGKNKRNTAIAQYEKVITSIDDVLDTSHPLELASHAALVDLFERSGKSDEATAHCLAIGKMTPWTENIEPTPLYRADPKYPKNMARNGKEGFTVMEFTISSFGFVKDIEVLETTRGGFEEESIKALEKWRYAPKVVNGEVVESERLKVRLDYTLG